LAFPDAGMQPPDEVVPPARGPPEHVSSCAHAVESASEARSIHSGRPLAPSLHAAKPIAASSVRGTALRYRLVKVSPCAAGRGVSRDNGPPREDTRSPPAPPSLPFPRGTLAAFDGRRRDPARRAVLRASCRTPGAPCSRTRRTATKRRPSRPGGAPSSGCSPPPLWTRGGARSRSGAALGYRSTSR
jgi:hypothetical protein